MKKNYFFENQGSLNSELKNWMGCKYRHMGETKSGVDCTKFIGLVLANLGILRDIERGTYYAKDWHISSKKEKVLESFDYHIENFLNSGFEVERLAYPKNHLLFGDVILMSFAASGVCNHSAIYIGKGRYVHALRKVGVCESQIAAIRNNIKYIYRVYY